MGGEMVGGQTRTYPTDNWWLVPFFVEHCSASGHL